MVTMKTAAAAIEQIRTVAAIYATAMYNEAQLEAGRQQVKRQAMDRIMESNNPDTGKPYAASVAEKLVEFDAEYRAYTSKQRDATAATIIARGEYDVAKRVADLYVASLEKPA